MESFDVQRALINSKFEGYKLELPHGEVIARYDLPYKPTQATVSGRAPLAFQEVQSRITHNHLTLSGETNHALYVDSTNRVILTTLTDPPTFQIIYELPEPVQTTSSFRHPEYPSAIFFRSDVILVADGHGLLYVLKLRDGDVSQVLGIFTISTDSLESPFRIHSSYRESSDVATVLVTSRYYDPNFASAQRSAKSEKVQFDVCAIRIDLSILDPNVLSPLPVIWHRRGKEVPIFTNFISAVNAFLLIGGSVYREPEFPELPTYEPSPDEYAPIPRTNENLDGDKQDSPPKSHPYSWTQSSDSVTVAFPLPSSTPKTKIKVFFTPKTLTLHVESEDSDVHTEPSVLIPKYSAKLLWDTISPSTSFWTWDKEADRSVGLLTLHLDKANGGTRWMQVFAKAATTSADSQQGDAEIPETLDPSELWHIRESLEKYTESLRTSHVASGLGLGAGVSSLGLDEMDEEVDQSIGREAYQTWIGLDGHAPSWWKNALPLPFNLLSTPLPGVVASSDPTLIIKSHIDGALFSPIGHVNPPRWEHTSSFSALAFVLASKQDTRFTHHTNKAVFAFDGGTKDRGGNVYIYRVAPVSNKWAKQSILKIDDGCGGPLLGVGARSTADGLELVCLTEGELVLVKSS